MLKAIDVAKWFIKENCDTPPNSFDGNMKLQKMLYFAQLIHLTREGEPLFEDEIYAFENGSVVEDVRLEYKHNYLGLNKEARSCNKPFASSELTTMKTTKEIFCTLTARKLSDYNHLQYGWEEAYHRSLNLETGFKDKEKSVISIDTIRAKDLSSIKKVLEAHALSSQKHYECEIVNGVRFFYDPQEMAISDDISAQLEKACLDGCGDDAYSISLDEQLGLIIS